MTPNQLLVAFVMISWALAWLSIKISHLMNGRPLSDGPSLLPLLLVVPLSSILVGVGLNKIFSPLGTVTIFLLYLGYVLFAFGTIWLHNYRSANDPDTDSSDGG